MPNFTASQGIAQYAADGCLVKPLLVSVFQDDAPVSFDLNVEWRGSRAPDGWFHPSTHPLMSDAALLSYLHAPPVPGRDGFGYTAKMAVRFGTVMHEVTGVMLDRLGVTVPLPEGPCVACGRPRPKPGRPKRSGQCGEHGFVDEATRSRGHMDKILFFKQTGTSGYDFKTRYGWGLNKVPDMDLEYFKREFPQYYAQGQEYMRLSGLRHFIVLFMSLGSPWEFREFQFDYDPVWNMAIEAKYRRVLAMAGVAA